MLLFSVTELCLVLWSAEEQCCIDVSLQQADPTVPERADLTRQASSWHAGGNDQAPESLSRQSLVRAGGLLLTATAASSLMPARIRAEEFVDDGISAGELPSAVREPSPDSSGNAGAEVGLEPL